MDPIKNPSEELSDKLAWSHAPLRPQSARSQLQSARPQSHRFLQDRTTSLRPASAQHESSMYQRGWLMSDLENWREAFQEEAYNCINSLKDALECSDVKRLASQFCEERQADAAQISGLRDHVTNLLHLNCTLRQNTLDMLSKDELARLRSCIETSVTSFSQLLDKHQMQHQINLEDVAKQAALHASDVSARALEEFSKLWQQQSSDMKLVEDERWSSMHLQVESVSQKIQQLESDWQSKCDGLATRFEEHLGQAMSGLSEKNFNDIQSLSTNQSKALQQLEDNFSSNLQTLAGKIENELSDTSNNCKQLRVEICDKLEDFAIVQKTSTEQEVHMEEEMKVLHKQLADMQSELVNAQHALEAKTVEAAPSPTQLLETIRDIERRGNVNIDLATGDVEVLKGMDFVPRKSSEKPIAEFSNHQVGEASLDDVVKLQKLFSVPMVVEGHTKGGDTGFWESLAINRSMYVMDKLDRQGVPKEMITAKGLPGRKGVNRPCIIIRLDIFPNYD